ncbi:MAG: LL-diaminopimelate aminotransferase [Candidatus Firestonebacteria bacterium]
MKIKAANRLKKLPPYLFIEIDKMKKKAKEDGIDVIDLGIGDPDLPTLTPIIDKMAEEIRKPENHKYPLGSGLKELKIAISNWYMKRFNVSLNPDNEVLALIGSKEGIGHIPLSFVNPGDVVLIPDPGYPAYNSGTIFAGGIPYIMPLLEKNNYLPELKKIPVKVLKKSKLMFLNYPNNPTSSVATKDFFEEVVRFAKKYNIIICHDAAYSEIYYDNIKPISFLEIKGAKDVGVEFHSLSKTFNMTGWRIGFAVGNKDVLSGLAKTKENVDSGIFHAIQKAGITALNLPDRFTNDLRRIYQERRDCLINGLRSIGLDVNNPMATFYVWVKVPERFISKKVKSSSSEFVKYLLTKAGIVSTPGIGFGKYGEGYIRMTITTSIERIREAIDRLKKLCP